MIPWLVDIALAAASAVLSALSAANFWPIRRSEVGRYMLTVSLALTAYSIVAALSFAAWMTAGHGIDVAGPSMAISASLLAVAAVLYRLSAL